MRLNFFYCKVFVFFIVLGNNFVFAEDSLLGNNLENSINSSGIKENVIQEETETLNKELEAIKSRLNNAELEKEGLKQQLSEYQTKEEQEVIKTNKIMVLKQVLAEDPFVVKDIEDSDYNFAYQSIMLGNLAKAEEHLSLFLKKDFNTYKVSENSEEQKKFLQNASNLKNKANYLLGAMKMITLLPDQAVPYLVESYKNSVDAALVLLSLFKLSEAFDTLKRPAEACLTLSKVYNTVAQIQEIEPSFVLTSAETNLIEDLTQKNSCEFKVKEKIDVSANASLDSQSNAMDPQTTSQTTSQANSQNEAQINTQGNLQDNAIDSQPPTSTSNATSTGGDSFEIKLEESKSTTGNTAENTNLPKK